MKTNRKVICSSSAVRYAETLFELNIPKETIEKTREIFLKYRRSQMFWTIRRFVKRRRNRS